MEVEIELKFIFNAAFADTLYSTLNKFHCISNKTQFLHNVYFDTADRRLRQFDMGLRVRSCDGKAVQTIKTAGRVIGGLHQRPEYNEPIEGLRPELTRFPTKIWPENSDTQELQKALTPIFSTDFERQTWLIEIANDTLIEVAYDSGFVETNKGKVALCEIELELVKGDEKQLFILGEQIAHLPSVRLGNVSKAQRGYMLADNATFDIKPLEHSPISESLSVTQALLANLQHGLKQIQYHENCFIEGHQLEALCELLNGVKFLHQNIVLFKNEIDGLTQTPWIEDLHWLARSFSWLDEYFIQSRLLENKAYYLRKLPKSKNLIRQINTQQRALPEIEPIISLLTSSRYCQFILSFTEWSIQLEKSTFSGDKSNNIIPFARRTLDNTWNEIAKALNNSDELSVQQFLAYQGLLESALLTGLSVGNVFSRQQSNLFRSPWLDIKQGLNEFSMLNLIDEIAHDEPDNALQYEYLKWIQRKQNSLLHALQQSKQQALLKPVYWQEEK
ncbi:adenylate cyclase [Psychromonas sp. psych-6C06]|uniref:CYTH and CHAD domain-containing protein n=1 Tax=Psychromonas sp. psych-6C06 TaxID=2058089 RepID=UPI000C349697|nr:CYTH and CHAD domain-containing protein [Psychromonas sp. psych-6C06]PKF61687.1 adenylate cyclase [Psychromonas sp. psych-6C06]